MYSPAIEKYERTHTPTRAEALVNHAGRIQADLGIREDASFAEEHKKEILETYARLHNIRTVAIKLKISRYIVRAVLSDAGMLQGHRYHGRKTNV